MSPAAHPADIVAVFDAAAALRRKPLLVVEDRVLHYGAVLDRVARLTRLFREHGWGPGERVLIASSDPDVTVTLHLALLRNGITSIVADPTASEREARVILGIAMPRAVFVDSALSAAWRPPAQGEEIEIHRTRAAAGSLFRKLLPGREPGAPSSTSYPALLERFEPDEPPARIDPESIAYVLFTSGSTATPKGVCVSHRALFHHLATLRRQFAYGSDTRLLNVLPLHHTDGLNHGPLTAFTCGGTVYRLARFTLRHLELLVDSVYKERITHMIAVPTLLAMIAQMDPEFDDAFDTADLRCVISSAAPLAPSLWEAFQTRFRTRVANVYGLTETVVGGLFCGPTDTGFRLGTVGKPVDCVARVVDVDGACVAEGEIGELELRGNNLFSGYLADATTTAAAFRDGWFRTGDLTTRDPDGFFHVAGRRKNLIICGGYNVQPEEVTEVLVSMPEVVEAVTLGVPDETFGERVVCAVSLAEGSTTEEAALIAFCRRHLAPVKVPTRVHVLPLLPKGASGKIDSQQVRTLIDAAGRRRTRDAAGDLHARVIMLAAESFGVPAADLGARSSAENTPGWDSFAHLQFVVALEESFGVRLTTRDVLRLATLADAESIVRERLG